MNIKYNDDEASFYFICEACGEPIEDLKGVVDFPMCHSRNSKAPLRFYHKGNCAFNGNERRIKDRWGNWQLDDFAENLFNGELPETIKLMCGIDQTQKLREKQERKRKADINRRIKNRLRNKR